MSERTAGPELRLYGHRGSHIDRPENTLVSFAHALEVGANALETDVHMTADGHVVVSHDPDGRRSAGVSHRICESTLREVQSWDAGWGFVDDSGDRPFAGQGSRIPTLADVIDAFPGVRINIDIKQRQPSMVVPFLEVLRDLDAEERVTVASFHAENVREIRARNFRGETALVRDELIALALMPALIHSRLPLSGGQAAQVPTRAGLLTLSSRAFITKCHAAGLRVDYWTINDPVEAAVLLDRGADGIMTDDPATIAPVLQRARSWSLIS